MSTATVLGVTTPRRTVPTDTPCPRCGQLMEMRQWKPAVAEDVELDWLDEGKVCPRGCQLTAGEVQ